MTSGATMMALGFLWSWLALSGSAVTVEGDSRCPTAPEIAARVAELLPPVTTAASLPDRARVDDQGDALRISVQRPDGSLIGERTLARSFPCPDLAAAAAVIIATWESDVHPNFGKPCRRRGSRQRPRARPRWSWRRRPDHRAADRRSMSGAPCSDRWRPAGTAAARRWAGWSSPA